jgi:hypothetical protein
MTELNAVVCRRYKLTKGFRGSSSVLFRPAAQKKKKH